MATPTKTTTAKSDPNADTPQMVLRISAKTKEGFRRCGVHHPAQTTDYPEGAFTSDQIKVLKGEPNLIVQDL